MKKASSFTFYFLYFAAIASLFPFVVLFYQQLGFTGVQIGLVSGMAPLISLVGAPLWTGIADATRRHKLVMSLAMLVTVLLALVYPTLRTLAPIVVLVAIFSFISAPIGSFADSATMSMLGDEKAKYGRLRLGGTIGFGLAAPIAGALIQTYGLKMAFWCYAALMGLALVVSQQFVFRQAEAAVGSFRSGLRLLLANRRWVLFLLMAMLGGVAFATINNYLFPYLKELGANETTMGVSVVIGTLSELPVLFFANRLLKRLGAHGLLVLSLVVTAARLLLYAALNFPAGVLASQLLNGLTIPALWVAGVSYANENAPAGMQATAQGLFGAMVFGFGAGVGGFVGGLLLDAAGGQLMYLVIGSFVLVGVGIISLVERRV